VTSKAATIALLLSTTLLSTFCDRNMAVNRDAATAANDTRTADLPRGRVGHDPICIPVLELLPINDFLRRHGIPLFLSTTDSTKREPPAPSRQDAVEVCYVPGVAGAARSSAAYSAFTR